MSLLPTSTFAGPSQAEALWAVAGSVGPGGGVTQLVAGSGITLDPATGEGVVTINATGGSGGVSSVTASGDGITASPTSGAVVVANTGVTSMVAGAGISLSGATGAVTVTNTGANTLSVTRWLSGATPSLVNINTDMFILPGFNDSGGWITPLASDNTTFLLLLSNPAWNLNNDTFSFQIDSYDGSDTLSTVYSWCGAFGANVRIQIKLSGVAPSGGRVRGTFRRTAGFPVTTVP